MNTKNLTVCKSNAVIQAGYQLSLNEQRVVLASIGLVDPRKELLVTDRFELSAKDFVVIFGVTEKNAYRTLIEVAQTLFKRYVVIEKPFPDNPKVTKLQTHWISSICYMESEGKIALTFAPDLIPYLTQLKGSFTRYDLKHIGNMTSTYGIRLYELLMQWKNTGIREIEIEWLKKQFQLDSSYDRMDNLKRRVIDPAVKDINQHSNYQARWEQRKTGRKVTHLVFTFSENKPPEDKESKTKKTTQETTLLGVPFTEIMMENGIDEPYQDTAARINRTKQANKTAPVHAGDLAKGLKDGKPAAPVNTGIIDHEAHRIEKIKRFMSVKKEDWLKEFAALQFVNVPTIGIVLEPDLRLAGLFD
jgi:plasmid replication initiation protein